MPIEGGDIAVEICAEAMDPVRNFCAAHATFSFALILSGACVRLTDGISTIRLIHPAANGRDTAIRSQP
jgi:hypothetical protein